MLLDSYFNRHQYFFFFLSMACFYLDTGIHSLDFMKIWRVGFGCFSKCTCTFPPYLCKEEIGQESNIVHVCAVVSRPRLPCQDTHTAVQTCLCSLSIHPNLTSLPFVLLVPLFAGWMSHHNQPVQNVAGTLKTSKQH